MAERFLSQQSTDVLPHVPEQTRYPGEPEWPKSDPRRGVLPRVSIDVEQAAVPQGTDIERWSVSCVLPHWHHDTNELWEVKLYRDDGSVTALYADSEIEAEAMAQELATIGVTHE